jgi:hypothetical protein
MFRKTKQAHKSNTAVESAPATLIPWLADTIHQPETRLQIKLRGNILHVLCQSDTALDREIVLLRLVRGLIEPETQKRFAREFKQIYQLYFYSRQPHHKQPDWSAPIYLNRLEHHLEQLVSTSDDAVRIQQAAAALYGPIGKLDEHTSAIVLSNVSLARKGDPEAIAQYLSETLSALDVGVKVTVRAIPGKAQRSRQAITAARGSDQPVTVDPGTELINRLWIFCQANYSPDPALIAQPTAQRLRDLELTQFQDAVIAIQVIGEDRPDWRLRVDLTPAVEILKEWARWGDLESLTRLLQQTLQPLGVSLTTKLKDATLHLICQVDAAAPAPDPAAMIEAVSHLLDQLAPQGIHRVMMYGPTPDQITPGWLKSWELPAAEHAALAETTEALAHSGDLPALAYVLTRLLNPHLDQQLATGGLRVQLLIKGKRLHVMTDGPVCPPRRQVVPLLLKYLRQHRWPQLAGIRIYGRRAGQKRPDWHHGHDFSAQKRFVPRATPEFAASDIHLGDLLTPEAEAAAEVSPQPGGSLWRTLGRQIADRVQQGLLQSQLFTPLEEQPWRVPDADFLGGTRKRIALVWGAVGLLLALQADWITGQMLKIPQKAAPVAAAPSPAPASLTLAEELSNLNWGRSTVTDQEGSWFSQNDFTEDNLASSAINDAELLGSPPQSFAETSALLSASPYPSFRSQQLDEKLALYAQHVAEWGVPDVLVLGSSRALRGIDPAALEQALAAVGHGDLRVFNFGVNGATAQVVDLIVRQLLTDYPPPKVILWADGVRALNSGTVDITFNSIAASEGYQQLQDGTLFPERGPVTALPEWENLAQQISGYYQQTDQRISRWLGYASSTYTDREGLKTLARRGVSQAFSDLIQQPALPAAKEDEETESGFIDFDGFLALSTRFNPATYYQKHAQVLGAYDSDYENFKIQGVQSRALLNLLRYTQSQGIPLIFVNTPLTDEYLDTTRLEAEQIFQRYMLTLAAQESRFVYRDLAQLWPNRYDYFSDPSHLNRYGAYQVSNRLAQDPMIPWPQEP